MKRKQIAVAGQDHVRAAVQRDFQKSIIVGVAALADRVDDGHEFGDAAERTQEPERSKAPPCRKERDKGGAPIHPIKIKNKSKAAAGMPAPHWLHRQLRGKSHDKDVRQA